MVKNKTKLVIFILIISSGLSIKAMHQLFDKKAPVEIEMKRLDRSHKKESPIIKAARTGRLKKLQHAIDSGADVDTLNPYGATPLMLASMYDEYLDVVESLIKSGANVNATAHLALTPLKIALVAKNEAAARALLLAKADPTGPITIQDSPEEGLPLILATKNNLPDMVNMLVKLGADVNAAVTSVNDAVSGTTALHEASYTGNTNIVNTLINLGADVNVKDKFMKDTPLGRASQCGHLDVVNSLLAAGSRIDDGNALNRTPLMEASKTGNLEIVSSLLRAGADVNRSDFLNETALSLAIKNGHPKVSAAITKAKAKKSLKS